MPPVATVTGSGPPTPPANDECTAAIVLETEPGFGLPYTTTPVNIFAATVSSDPATCVASTNTIWYSFTPTATDYFQFTSLINRHFTMDQKIRVIELMWSVAWADDELSPHERHLMRKIVDLLHVPHGDAAAAQARARGGAG